MKSEFVHAVGVLCSTEQTSSPETNLAAKSVSVPSAMTRLAHFAKLKCRTRANIASTSHLSISEVKVLMCGLASHVTSLDHSEEFSGSQLRCRPHSPPREEHLVSASIADLPMPNKRTSHTQLCEANSTYSRLSTECLQPQAPQARVGCPRPFNSQFYIQILWKNSQTRLTLHWSRILKVLPSRMHLLALSPHRLSCFASNDVELPYSFRSCTPRCSQCLTISSLMSVFVIK